jgi:hypothetical protein
MDLVLEHKEAFAIWELTIASASPILVIRVMDLSALETPDVHHPALVISH